MHFFSIPFCVKIISVFYIALLEAVKEITIRKVGIALFLTGSHLPY